MQYYKLFRCHNQCGNIPQQPDSIIGNTNPSPGDTVEYNVSYIAGVTYLWSAPSGWTGISGSNSIIYIAGKGQGNISVITSNFCGLSPVRTLFVKTGYSISGYFTYDDFLLHLWIQ